MAATKTLTLPEAVEMILQVHVDEGERMLYMLFGDARYLSIPVEVLERAVGVGTVLDLSRVELTDPYGLRIGTQEGESEEFPADYLRYLADPEYARQQHEWAGRAQRCWGKHVQRLRKERKLSRRTLAERAGLSETTLARLERGEIPASLCVLRKLAQALDLPLKALLPPVRTSEP